MAKAEVTDRDPLRELLRAHEGEAVVRALANALAPGVRHIPSLADLAHWISNCHSDVVDETREAAAAVGLIGPGAFDPGIAAASLLSWRWRRVQRTLGETGGALGPTLQLSCEAIGVRHGVEHIHQMWAMASQGPIAAGEAPPLHPLGALVMTWVPARKVDPDTHTYGLMPTPFSIVRHLGGEDGTLMGELFGDGDKGEQRDLFERLPGFEPPSRSKRVIVPAAPLVLFDLSRGRRRPLAQARGRGAPLPLRLWIESILSVQRSDRQRPALLTSRLRDLIAALWPDDWSGPARDGERLLDALQAVHNSRVPWRFDGPDGPISYWVAVTVLAMPDVRDGRSWVAVEVKLPPGSASGAMVHRPSLRRWGVQSAPAYRLTLSLAYLWNQYLTHRGKRLPPTVPLVVRNEHGVVLDAEGNPLMHQGRPVVHWSDRRAVRTGCTVRNPELERRLPWLDPDDLLLMGAPGAALDTVVGRRDTRRRLRDALTTMESKGEVVMFKDGPRRRIEPPDWWGDPSRP